MKINPIVIQYRSWVDEIEGQTTYKEEKIEINIDTGESRVIGYIEEGTSGRPVHPPYSPDPSPECLAWVVGKLPSLRRQLEEKRKRQQYWTVQILDGKVSFKHHEFGFPTKAEAKERKINDIKIEIKEAARSLNRTMLDLQSGRDWMNENKKNLSLVESLKP